MGSPRGPVEFTPRDLAALPELLGSNDAHLRLIERSFPDTAITVTGSSFTLEGPTAAEVQRLLTELDSLLGRGEQLDEATVHAAISRLADDLCPSASDSGIPALRTAAGKPVRPSTAGQRAYLQTIGASTVTFGLGPAGTGKSYLAVAVAVHALMTRQVKRIVLTRPAVEAGERLGFLPGDLVAKVDPYLRPLYDALFELLGTEQAQRMLEKGVIEIAPLAFMRGRTLSDAFIILDEAQNTTPEQMKMFLTRIGFGSKAVVTGDGSQIDLPGGRSGLAGIERILGGVEQIGFVHLTARDVVRSSITAAIVSAYEHDEASRVPKQH